MSAFLLLLLTQSGPLDFARTELQRACETANLAAQTPQFEITISPGTAPESFTITRADKHISIAGSDPSGALYGALDLAERILIDGERALTGRPIESHPYLADRALNLFLTLPWNSDTNEPDYDLAALTDPARWWFHDDDYWTTLFDSMARSRLNWLDLHGTYDIHTTRFPNLYAYFVSSPSFPEVGVARGIQDKNLAQLNHVIELAHARGVRVSLMSYEARFYTPHNPKPPYEETEAGDQTYTREVVERAIRGLPGLDAIGFRIGESGHGGAFFQSYLDAVKASGRDIPLYTRSWVTRKSQVVPLARAANDFTVEIKFNGEQWGPPYPIAGGRVPGWYSYSFEDYLSDSGTEPAQKLWPGNVSPEGESWPSEPYRIVWQVRANGTHRIFPFYEPDWVRRTIRTMKIGTASGYSVEAMNAYFPATPRYYLADPADQYCKWIHQRDEMYLMLWGRLGYDPETPESAFQAALQRKFGLQGKELGQSWKFASSLVPTAFTAWSLGPDHRSQAPELEWGGTTDDFIQTEPFDAHSFMSVKEALALAATGGKDGRWTLTDAADKLRDTRARMAIERIHAGRTDVREICAASGMLGNLSEYYESRFECAELKGLAEATGDEEVWSATNIFMDGALAAWRRLSDSPESAYYKPFTDRLRMGTDHFHWRSELPKLEAEARRLAGIRFSDLTGGEDSLSRAPCFGQATLTWRSEQDALVATVVAQNIDAAWLLEKPMPSSTFFHKTSMLRVEDRFEAHFERRNSGHLIAAEIEVDGGIRRIPIWTEETPYLVIPARQGPTPKYYSSEEALTYLRQEVLDPGRYGTLLLASRAWNFHRGFDVPTQRKLLDAVARGMTLLVLQQDYASGRYPLSWLPNPPSVVNAPTTVFDPAGALGLEKVETDAVLWQPFRPTEGWEVFGNGGVAHQEYGDGHIWMVQARLLQRMHIPGCARNLKRLLEMGGREKPVVVVDPGSEGAQYATSVFCDFMNAHDVPFLTLGEVIAREQGMDSAAPVVGRIWPDRILQGGGPAMLKAFLRAKVTAAAEEPGRPDVLPPAGVRKRELMRSLGLDPLPPRTPLDARITGTLQRDGYRIEKLVYESRPGMPVTAHLYVPDGATGKLSVVVNPHGHWPHKKSEPVVQARAIAQALHGYLALVVDSPGHSFEGDALIERREAGPHDDLRLVLGSSNATAIYVWDLMRGLDYLETRPEADMSRVGITGESGGGLATVYAFAADERFGCAVPVCYATSLAVNPENGCLCNHVPGTLQIGDRADVLAIRAPAPVFVIGARDDVEFPPEGTRRTGEKLANLWRLADGKGRTRWQIFDSGHDYNQPMREAALGFFDQHLRGLGDGSPVPEPKLRTEPAESRELLCLAEPPRSQVTMRDVARAKLLAARPAAPDRSAWYAFVELNGGYPGLRGGSDMLVGEEVQTLFSPSFQVLANAALPAYVELGTIETEPGLRIPGILRIPTHGKVRAGLVLVSERGKLAAEREFDVPRLLELGYACLSIDARGTGELAGLDPRLMTYLGTSDAFAMGWDAACASRVLRGHASKIAVIGSGPVASQAALIAGLMLEQGPRSGRGSLFASVDSVLVVGLEALRSFDECFEPEVPVAAIQPRADLAPSLESLRALSHRALWQFRGEPPLDLAEELDRWSKD
jgi:dienelactone hydrolase